MPLNSTVPQGDKLCQYVKIPGSHNSMFDLQFFEKNEQNNFENKQKTPALFSPMDRFFSLLY